eukprot:PhM_4_TR13929/c1_g1_i2/m.100525
MYKTVYHVLQLCLVVFALTTTINAAGIHDSALTELLSDLRGLPQTTAGAEEVVHTLPGDMDYAVTIGMPTAGGIIASNKLVPIPVALAPLCIATNAAHGASMTPSQLGEVLRGDTTAATRAALPWLYPPVPPAQSAAPLIVLPNATSGVGHALLSSLSMLGIEGFVVASGTHTPPAPTAYPSSVLANPNVRITASATSSELLGPVLSTSVSVRVVVSIASSLAGYASSPARPECVLLMWHTEQRVPVLLPPLLFERDARNLQVHMDTLDAGVAYADVTAYPLMAPVVVHVDGVRACNGLGDAEAYTEFLLLNRTTTSTFARFGVTSLPATDVQTAYSLLLRSVCSSTPRVVGGGSSAIAPLMHEWFVSATSIAARERVLYEGVGSGGGLRGLLDGTYVLAGSDVGLSDEDVAARPTLRQVPVVALSASLVYSFGDRAEGTPQLSLPTCAVVDLLRGIITHWDDARLLESNPTVSMPHEPVRIIARRGTSGTTMIVSEGLRRLETVCRGASAGASLPVGSQWPFTTGNLTYVDSDSEMRAAVKAMPYSIGYLATPTVGGTLREAWLWSYTTGLLRPIRSDMLHWFESGDADSSLDGFVYPFFGIGYVVFDAAQNSSVIFSCSAYRTAYDFIVSSLGFSVSYLLPAISYVEVPGAASTAIELFSRAMCDNQNLYMQPDKISPGNSLMFVLMLGSLCGVAVLWVAWRKLTALRTRSVAETLSTRSLHVAPKNTGVPIAIVFTDIQWNSALWARVPIVMGTAQDAHHDIIRRVAGECHGYEVRSTGESFMLAFSSADDAVRFALRVQQDLYEHDWDTSEIDATYAALSDDDSPAEEYDQAWHGLRVRIGIGFGYCGIDYQPTTKGFVYSGTPVETAAMAELMAHGGQTIVTSSVWSACTASFLENEAKVDDLGNYNSAMRVYQVMPPALAATRAFGELRRTNQITGAVLDPVRALDASSLDDEDTAPHLKGVAELEGTINLLISTLPLRDRAAVLTTLCSRWRVRYSGKSSSDDIKFGVSGLAWKLHRVNIMRDVVPGATMSTHTSNSNDSLGSNGRASSPTKQNRQNGSSSTRNNSTFVSGITHWAMQRKQHQHQQQQPHNSNNNNNNNNNNSDTNIEARYARTTTTTTATTPFSSSGSGGGGSSQQQNDDGVPSRIQCS